MILLFQVLTCAQGYHNDGIGVYIRNNSIPIPTLICPKGYKNDGNGNCDISFEPIVCDTRFISNG